MALFKLDGFLDKFKKLASLGTHDKVVENHVREWCKKKFPTEADNFNISYKKNTVVISHQSSAIKNFFFIYQQELTEGIKKEFSLKDPVRVVFK